MKTTSGIPHSDQELSERLRERGLRATSQRLVIHRLLRERNRHLTAELLDEASARAPSRDLLPTVYSTLELFEELGVVHRVNGGGGTLLWDTRGDDHHHLVCRRCGQVEDIDSHSTSRAPAARLSAPASPPTAPRSWSAALCERARGAGRSD